MARYVASSTAGEIKKSLLEGIPADTAGRFLREELERYVPLFASKTPQQIQRFSAYQQAVYLKGNVPTIGKPIASLNPHYVDGVGALTFGPGVYTRASVKENGYRFQLHNGLQVKAFTRQFVPYDLRMFPELADIFDELPVMIGDAELINSRHEHLAGFHRVQLRLPNCRYWPKKGDHIDDALLKEYLGDPRLFADGEALPDTELTLSFHGMFAISDPDSWHLHKDVQQKTLTSYCKLPVDQRRVGMVLDELESHLQHTGLSARVPRRVVVTSPRGLEQFIAQAAKDTLEGVCVAQSVPGRCAPMYKFKRYESVDTALLGLYLCDKEKTVTQSNIRAALLGIFDNESGNYLPCVKVNLDGHGVQVKTVGQKQRLRGIREEIAHLATPGEAPVMTLSDVYAGRTSNTADARTIKTASRKLKKPDVVLDMTSPIIVEAQVFDIKRGMCAYPAGFDGTTCYVFNNAYPERLRHDKSTTTDYSTIERIAAKNTPSPSSASLAVDPVCDDEE